MLIQRVSRDLTTSGAAWLFWYGPIAVMERSRIPECIYRAFRSDSNRDSAPSAKMN